MAIPLTARTLLADDHVLLRQAVRATLELQGDFRVVAEVGDGAEAVSVALRERVDLAIIDISMPTVTGIDVARQLRDHRPDIKVLILTMHEREDLLFEALRAGAAGYVVKSAAPADLVTAARAALRGEVYLYPEDLRPLMASFLAAARDGAVEMPDALSTRELGVLKLVAEGQTNKQIAEVLSISPKTVARHRESILGKLGMHDRVGLTRYAIRRGLIDP